MDIKNTIEKTVKILSKGEAVVSSLDIAKVFGKEHNELLRIIRRKIEFLTVEKFNSENYFILDDYVNSRGKEVPRYKITRKGFDYIVLSLKGKKAELYKLYYIDEFHRKQNHINKNIQVAYENKENPIWLEFRAQGKELHKELTDAIKKYFVDYRYNVEKKLNDGRYYTTIANLINKNQGIETPKGIKLIRDALDLRVLFKLEECEIKIAKSITEHSEQGLHYKLEYQAIKRELNR